MRSVLALSALASAILIAATPASAATVLDVSGNSDCGKTTCFNDQGVFTKTWSSKDASGPMTIGQILLARGVLGSLDGSTFRLSFQLDGKEIGSWGSYTMGGIAGDELSFSGENFTWNPEDGELTLVLEIVKPKVGLGGLVFRASEDEPNTDDTQPDPGQNLPPEQQDPRNEIGNEPSPAPEPAAWALMISGFGMAGATLRRRRIATAA